MLLISTQMRTRRIIRAGALFLPFFHAVKQILCNYLWRKYIFLNRMKVNQRSSNFPCSKGYKWLLFCRHVHNIYSRTFSDYHHLKWKKGSSKPLTQKFQNTREIGFLDKEHKPESFGFLPLFLNFIQLARYLLCW